MEPTKIWIEEQWKEKGFQLLMLFNIVAMVVLSVEFYRFQYSIMKVVRYLIMFFVLSLIAWIDGKSKRIPNKLLVLLIVIRTILLIMECIFYHEIWLTVIITFFMGALIGGGMFLFCYLITRGAVGAGDVKLLTVIGYYLGSGVIFTDIFLTVVLSTLYSVLQLILKKTGLKEEIPFAPFVYVGTLLTMALGM